MVQLANERTLVMLKPDAVARGLTGQILARIETRGLVLTALKRIQVTLDQAQAHYQEHEGKPFHRGLLTYIRSGPVVAAVVEGPRAVDAIRSLVGATDPLKAAPGTIRGDFGLVIEENLVHASDSVASAEREIAVYFSAQEIVPATHAGEA